VFRLELLITDEGEREPGQDDPAVVGFDVRTTTEAQAATAVMMLRSVANKLEQHMGLTKYGSAEPIEPEGDQSAELAKTASDQWTAEDAEQRGRRVTRVMAMNTSVTGNNTSPVSGWRKPYRSCETVRRLLRVSDHCTSCHDDEDRGYGMCEIDTRKGVVSVCCRVALAARRS
jgi:hypothetical protein